MLTVDLNGKHDYLLIGLHAYRICALEKEKGGIAMKTWMILPILVLLVLSGHGIAWSQGMQGMMSNGYWYRTNTTTDQLHKDYTQCMDKNEAQCMKGKGYRWMMEGQNPGFWTKANTTIDQLHKDYAQCMDKNEFECMEAKGYKWTTEGRLRSY